MLISVNTKKCVLTATFRPALVWHCTSEVNSSPYLAKHGGPHVERGDLIEALTHFGYAPGIEACGECGHERPDQSESAVVVCFDWEGSGYGYQEDLDTVLADAKEIFSDVEVFKRDCSGDSV